MKKFFEIILLSLLSVIGYLPMLCMMLLACMYPETTKLSMWTYYGLLIALVVVWCIMHPFVKLGMQATTFISSPTDRLTKTWQKVAIVILGIVGVVMALVVGVFVLKNLNGANIVLRQLITLCFVYLLLVVVDVMKFLKKDYHIIETGKD